MAPGHAEHAVIDVGWLLRPSFEHAKRGAATAAVKLAGSRCSARSVADRGHDLRPALMRW